jgi:hypothetical protein
VNEGDARLAFDTPVACVIRVRGAHAPEWIERHWGLTRTRVDGRPAGAGATTELRGALRGQAALLGVLRTLHAQGLSLVSVDCAPAPRPAGVNARGAAPA